MGLVVMPAVHCVLQLVPCGCRLLHKGGAGAARVCGPPIFCISISPPITTQNTGVCMDVVTQLPDVPVLGVCLGHQALAHAAGACVVRAPEPVHGRLSALQHNGHPLFEGCPSGPGGTFDVVR